MTLTIPAHDRGHVYLFALPDRGEIADLLGLRYLDMAQVDDIQIAEIEDLGLAGYLTEGMGIPVEQIRADVRALSGRVAVLRSAAFGGRDVEIAPMPGVRHVATFAEPGLDVTAVDMQSASAKGVMGGKPAPSQGAILGRVAMIALLVIFLLTLVMVWIA